MVSKSYSDSQVLFVNHLYIIEASIADSLPLNWHREKLFSIPTATRTVYDSGQHTHIDKLPGTHTKM